MGKILVLYHSNSGNTESMARLVSEGAAEVEQTESRTLSVDAATVEDLKWCDGIAIGCPTNFGTISWPMKKWWDELPLETWGTQDGKIGCAFSSSGAWGGGSELTCMALLLVLINYGFLTFGVTDYTGVKFSPHYGSIVAGEPRAEHEIASCRRLGRRLSEWVAAYREGRSDAHPLAQDYPRFDQLGK
ncbi:MAG: flavodoxin [Planctomycetaceae bacterium]|nr:flavodoxin [Planctomycetaceae bacterium]